MTLKKITWQREIVETSAGELRLQGCPLSKLDDFAALMTLFNEHIQASSDDATMAQLYESNKHFREVTGKALALCGININFLGYEDIPPLLHSYLERDGAFYPGKLVQINFPFSKKNRYSPIENLETSGLTDVVEELTDAIELLEELEKANGGSRDNNI